MPKIRTAHTPEDAARVSPEEPLEINLGAQAIEPTEIIYGKPDKKTEPPQQQKAPPPPATPEPPAEPDDDAPSLQSQLDQIKQSEELARARAAQAEADRNAYYQQAQQREQEMARLRSQTDGAHHETLVSAIAAAQSEVESAKQAYVTARQANDFAAEADAQDRLATARSRLVSLEAGKDELERRIKEQPQQRQHQVPLPSPSGIEQALSSMPGLIDSEREYLRRHPDAIMDPANQRRLEVAWLDAQKQGIERGSKAYYAFFDSRLGYQSKQQPREEEVERDRDTDQNEPMPAAPVSRSVPGQTRESDTRIVLTPQQREAARWAGVNEFEYAKGLMKLRQAKKDDRERYGS